MNTKKVFCSKNCFEPNNVFNKTLLLIIPIFLFSCGSLVQAPQEEKRELKNFDWTPPSTTNTKSADLAMILLRPNYVNKFEESKYPIFQKFSKNMGSDFEEMLTAKGYTIRGPYDTYDEIVFSDKSETDLMMMVEIDFISEWSNGISVKKASDPLTTYLGKPSFKYWIDGDLQMGGKINLIIYESMTREKLWVKSLKLNDKSIKITTNKISASDDNTAINQLSNSAGYLNPISTLLDEYYQQALNTAWNQLEGQELTAMKKQVKELRTKKEY